MWHWQKRLLLALFTSALCFASGAEPSPSRSGTVEAVPDAARKAVARRQERMASVQEKMVRGDRLLADREYEGAFTEYRAAFRAAPDFAMGVPLQAEAFAKYQMATRQYADRLAQNGRLDEARNVVQDLFKDARDAGMSPRAVDEDTKRLMADLQNPEVYNPAVTAQHVEKVKEVEKLLQLADGAYRIGDFDEASKQFAAVLGLDPANSAARKGLAMVDDHVNTQYNRPAKDHTRSKMLNEVAKAWESPVPRYDMQTGVTSEEMRAAKPAGPGSVQEKLRSLIVPDVEFVETPLQEALVLLSNRSRQLDPLGEGVNIVLRVKDAAMGSKPVTMSLRGAPLETVLDYLGRLSGTTHRVDGFAVAVVPLGDVSTSGLITKTYRVPPSFLSETAMATDQASGDPFAAPADGKPATGTIQPRLGAKAFLEKNGVSFTPGAAAQFNADTSTLIVRNTQDQLDLVEAMVQSSFGNVTKLLRVAVKAIDIGSLDLEETGFDWLMGSFGVGDKIQMGGGTYGGMTSGNGAGDFPVRDASGLPVPNMPVTGGLRSGDYALSRDSIDALIGQTQGVGVTEARAPGVFSATGLLTNPQFQTVLRAVSQHKASDGLLSSHVVMRSGQTATVKNIREFIYPTEYSPPEIPDAIGVNPPVGGVVLVGGFLPPVPVTPANPEAFTTREVGAQMQVEGTIGPDGYSVNLTLTPQIVEFQGFVNYGSPINYINSTIPNQILMPIFATQRAAVTVDVYDGQTLVIAGYLEEKVERVNDKVPGLGDAPFIGSLFRQKSERPQKRALLFFVSPTIVDPTGAPVRTPAAKVEVTAPPAGNP